MSFNTLVRSNYFKVQDPAEFELWCRRLEMETIHQQDEEHGALVGFRLFASDVPSQVQDLESGEPRDVEFWDELSQHLLPGEIAIVECAGNDGTDVEGWCLMVDSMGRYIGISLSDFYYTRSKELTGQVRTYPFDN